MTIKKLNFGTINIKMFSSLGFVSILKKHHNANERPSVESPVAESPVINAPTPTIQHYPVCALNDKCTDNECAGIHYCTGDKCICLSHTCPAMFPKAASCKNGPCRFGDSCRFGTNCYFWHKGETKCKHGYKNGEKTDCPYHFWIFKFKHGITNNKDNIICKDGKFCKDRTVSIYMPASILDSAGNPVDLCNKATAYVKDCVHIKAHYENVKFCPFIHLP